jgi:dihydropteroate synthase
MASMTRLYYRPLCQTDLARPETAQVLAGGWCWFDTVEVLSRAGVEGLMPAAALPAEIAARLSAPRVPLAGLSMSLPRLMGILNVTPDSFSDGGRHHSPDAAVAEALAMADAGADMIDIGGESTRPGAQMVPEQEEIARIAPVFDAVRRARGDLLLSIDTRKAAVAQAALARGAGLVNDVAALSHDAEMAALVSRAGVPLCLMHAQGSPETMQAAPHYDNVVLDVYDYLQERIAFAEAAGIARSRIVIDPGIGFGKTQAHNLALLRALSLFHGLGCPILLGASRKRFIGTIGAAAQPQARGPGTLAVTLAALAQGVQLHRVHDVTDIAQGVALWRALTLGEKV